MEKNYTAKASQVAVDEAKIFTNMFDVQVNHWGRFTLLEHWEALRALFLYVPGSHCDIFQRRIGDLLFSSGRGGWIPFIVKSDY